MRVRLLGNDYVILYITHVLERRGGRVAEGAGLENRSGASHRGFESHPLRQPVTSQLPVSPGIQKFPKIFKR